MQKNLQFEQGMLEEREKRVRQIEEDVLDVNQIMRELNTLINQQGEAIGMSSFSFSSHSFGIAKCDAFFCFSFADTIEGSIDHVAGDVEAGRTELLKAAEYQAKYRRKVAILLLIAVIIGLIVTGLVVSQFKS